jgi:hypothetical protein
VFEPPGAHEEEDCTEIVDLDAWFACVDRKAASPPPPPPPPPPAPVFEVPSQEEDCDEIDDVDEWFACVDRQTGF